MVVISLTDCPPKIRGDLSKWLCEINTGVYVGSVSARVRELLWNRICDNLSRGKATMVYSAANEQGMAFKVYNTTWEPVDLDGITLMRKPALGKASNTVTETLMSNASRYRKTQRIQAAQQRKAVSEGFVIVDFETSGLSPKIDEIIEIGALRVVEQEVTERLSILIQTDKKIPGFVTELTGITEKMLIDEGVPLKTAVQQLLCFIGDCPLVFYNAGFDRAFLKNSCDKINCAFPNNAYMDLMVMAKNKLEDVANYKLETIANYFDAAVTQTHRALEDCQLTLFVLKKLNEI